MEHGSKVPPRIKVSQYDYGWPIYIDLLYDGAAWTPPSGATALVQGTKKDRTGFSYGPESNVTWSSNRVTIPLTQQMTAFAGDVPVEVIIMLSTTQRIGSANFILEVEPAALDDNVTVSETDMPVFARLAELIVELDEAVRATEENAQIATQKAYESEAYANQSAESANTSREYSVVAGEKADAAQASANAAASSEHNAELLVNEAEAAAEASQYQASLSASSAAEASSQREAANMYAKMAHSWANGESTDTTYGDGTHNSYYWAEKARQIAQGLAGALIPMGSVMFMDLPPLADVETGWLYNIIDEFTTDARFKEGAGIKKGAGSEVYKTADGYYSVMSRDLVSSVAGFKGDVTATQVLNAGGIFIEV